MLSRFIATVFNSRRSTRTSGIEMLVFSLLNAAFNFLKSVIVATRYGASSVSDAYYASVNIINAPSGLLSDSLTALVLPRYQHHKTQGDEKDYLASYLSLVLFLFLLLSVFFVLAGPFIARLVLGGFVEETLSVVDRLIILSLPVIVLSPLTVIIDGALRAERFFIFGNLGGVINSLILILLLLVMRGGVSGIVVATMAGVAANFIVLLIVARRRGALNGRVSLRLGLREARNALPLVVGGLLGIAASYIEKSIASFLDVGTMTVLNMSNSLLGVASSILIGSLISVYYPFISEALVSDNKRSFEMHSEEARRLVFGIFGLAGACMMAFAQPLFSIIYERGAFEADDVSLLARLFSASAFLLLYYALANLANYAYYAKSDSKTTVLINVFSTYALGVAAQFGLSRWLGPVGLVIGLSSANLVNVFLKNLIIYRKYGLTLFGFRDGVILFAFFVASALSGLVQWTPFHYSLPLMYYLTISLLVYRLTPRRLISYVFKKSTSA